MKCTLLLLAIIIAVAASGQTAGRYEVVIDEIMADPSPQVGLPNNEWIELKNTSLTAFNLQGWRIEDASGLSGPMPSFMLEPDSFVIVCAGSAAAALTAFGTTISVSSFPSLDNGGEQLLLRSSQNNIIHAVEYSSTWYQNELKSEGGWSLEMIDTKNPCSGSSNWKAGINSNGGTPGKINSVDGINTDETAPRLKQAFTIDSVTIRVVFDEPLDSASGAGILNYRFDNGISVVNAIAISPFFNQVELKLDKKMEPQKVYQLTATNIIDCKGNISPENRARAGIAEELSAKDVIINEILFNPRMNANDYVEIYNRSNKICDASKMYLANRNGSNAISSVKQLSATPFYIFPGDYFVATEDLSNLQLNYLVKDPGHVFIISSMPSLPDDNGYALLLNSQGEITDEVDYDKGWHFKLLDNDEGISLERVSADGSSQDGGNWHSAASTAGFGTPTYQNSQYKKEEEINAILTITPPVFSPDNDGRDDIANIQYQVEEPGFVANINIYDAMGRPVKYLVKNGILGIKGNWTWDGLDDKNNPLPVGTYIISAEIFNLQGKKRQFKKTIVLARQF